MKEENVSRELRPFADKMFSTHAPLRVKSIRCNSVFSVF